MACSGDIEVGTDLVIERVVPRPSAGGAWVRGSLDGHSFDALVFAGNPGRAEWGFRGSGISKLQFVPGAHLRGALRDWRKYRALPL